MTVKKLRKILEDTLRDLDCYDDDQEDKMVSNTYFLGNPRYFLGVSGYDGGYISFDEPVEDDEEDED